MGAWIEIIEEFENILNGAVAPFVGAWIEICLSLAFRCTLMSLPSWEREFEVLLIKKMCF